MSPVRTASEANWLTTRALVRAFRNRSFLSLSFVAFLAMMIGGWLGALVVGPSGMSAWYPPAGIALGYLMLAGIRWMPVVLLARFAALGFGTADVIHSASLADRALRAVVIVSLYCIAVKLLANVKLERGHVRDFGHFVAVAVVGAPAVVGAVVGLMLKYINGASTELAITAARTLWVGDAAAIATITPTIIVGARVVNTQNVDTVALGSPMQRIEAVMAATALCLVPLVALVTNMNVVPVGYAALAVLPALWVAGRRNAFDALVGVLILNSGISLVVNMSLSPERLADFQIVMLAAALAALYVIALGVTARDQIAELLRDKDRIAYLDRMDALAQMGRGVAHDLRNMLTVVLGNADLLRDASHNQKETESELDEITKAGKAAALLAERLVQYSRATQSVPQIIEVNSAISEITPQLRALCGISAELRLSLASEMAFLSIDRSQFEQVIVNLVINACDRMPNGGVVTITVDVLQPLGPDFEYSVDTSPVSIAVTDTGPNISSGDIEHVFEPFYCSDGYESSGLRLATVYAAVVSSGGMVTVSNLPSIGSEFVILLQRCLPKESLPECVVSLEQTYTSVLADNRADTRAQVLNAFGGAGITCYAESSLLEARRRIMVLGHADLLVLGSAVGEGNALAFAREMLALHFVDQIVWMKTTPGFSGTELRDRFITTIDSCDVDELLSVAHNLRSGSAQR